MKDLLQKYKYIFIIVIVSAFVAVFNYEPGTWLTGWDNHHPEFDFTLNIFRDFYTVWRENRGLGLVDGISHATELPRELFLGFLSLFTPRSFLRYLWHFLMLIFGPVGFYAFLRGFYSPDDKNGDAAAFLGALFYLFNLGTLQNFFTPLSTFTTLYGFLPWLFYTALCFTSTLQRKYLYQFIVLSFFATPMAYTATLFAVYFGFLFLLLFTVVFKINTKEVYKASVRIILTVLVINSYWILPFTYFVFTNASNVSSSLINQLSSEDVFFKNKKYGNINDVILLKGYSFDTTDYDLESGNQLPIFSRWIAWGDIGIVRISGYVAVLFILLGLYKCARNRTLGGDIALVIFLFSFFFLMNDNPPLGFVIRFMRENLPLLKEALRFPYTKFSVFGILSYSMLFGFGIQTILSILDGKKVIKGLFAVIVTSSLVVWMYPLLNGHMLYDKLRIRIPVDYFELFDYLNDQDQNKRILYLPAHTHWSWRHHSWGYVGSGFIRYGIKQPLIDRSFDVWSKKNEALYRELSYAIYSGRRDLFRQVLDKYRISYILYDKSVTVPNASKNSLVTREDEIFDMLEKGSDFFKDASFGDSLDLYSYKNVSSNSVYYLENVSNITSDATWVYDDQIYSSYAHYISSDQAPSVYYPFVSVADHNFTDVEISEDENRIHIKTFVDTPGTLNLPNISDLSEVHAYKLDVSINTGVLRAVVTPIYPEISVENTLVTPYSVSEEHLVNVGDSDVYLAIGDETFNVVGDFEKKVYLDINESPNIYVTKKIPVENYPIIPLFHDEIENCGVSDGGSYSMRKDEEGLVINSIGNTPCITAHIRQRLTPGIYGIYINQTLENGKSYYCVIKNNVCLNNKDLLKYMPQEDVSELRDLWVLKEEVPDYYLQLYFAPKYRKLESVGAYSNITLYKYETLYVKPVFTNENITSADSLVVEVPKPSEITVSMIKDVDSSLYTLGVPLDDFNPQDSIKTCYFDKPQVHSADLVLDGFNEVLFMSSYDKRTCYTYENKRIPHKYSYLFSLNSQRISGKRQRVCLKNLENGRCDIVDTLYGDPQEWVSNYYIKPPMKETGKGYGFVIENISFGAEESINYYDDIRVIPFPYQYLKEIYVSDYNIATPDAVIDVGELKSIKKKPFKYVVNTGPKLSDATTVVLYQAYNPGWKAMCGLFPCRNVEHVLVDSWANGWVFDEVRRTKITLLFVPQILQTLGFLLILGGLFYEFFVEYLLFRKHLVRRLFHRSVPKEINGDVVIGDIAEKNEEAEPPQSTA